ncbi:hypothetical protein LXL04_015706 [Taraxacum kok-saghyz]
MTSYPNKSKHFLGNVAFTLFRHMAYSFRHMVGPKESKLEDRFGPRQISRPLHRKVESGTDSFFWLDDWLGSSPLKLSFPALYNLDSHKNCKRASVDRIPSAQALSKREIHLNTVNCALCDLEVETVDHLLCKCNYAKFVWEWILPWCGLQQQPTFNTVAEMIEFSFKWGNCPKKKRKIFTGICYGTTWAIWKARNDWVFNRKRTLPTIITDLIKSLYWVAQSSSKIDPLRRGIRFIEDEVDYAHFINIVYEDLDLPIFIYLDHSGDGLEDCGDSSSDEHETVIHLPTRKSYILKHVMKQERSGEFTIDLAQLYKRLPGLSSLQDWRSLARNLSRQWHFRATMSFDLLQCAVSLIKTSTF